MPGSLPHTIKWNPLFAFYRFSLLPSPPVASPPLPAFSFSPSGAGLPPAAPAAAENIGATSSPTTSGVATTPPSPAIPVAFPVRRPTSPPPPSAPQRCPHPGITSSSPEARRSGLLVGVQYLPASGRLLYVAGTPINVAALSSPPAAPLFHRNAVARAGLSILIVVDIPSAARSSSPARRLAAPPPSSDSQRRVPRRPRLRAAAAGCPRRLLAGPGRHRRRPLVVPGRRGVRPSVKLFSSVVRVRQVCRCSPVVVFVLASASSSPAPAASRLRPRIAAEVVPSPFASVVPEPSPPRSFVVVVPTPRRVVRFPKRGSRSSPKVRKAVLSEQGKSHHP
uniref:Cell wall protein-like n=1 Tax=Oryza sativa subsp. indica TaxID=39946 RepID=C8TF15_ORYSI|nr:cell wall protein-like [Oryza sativa Indica Group]